MTAAAFPLSEWRLIKTPPARGAWNMAVDEAILEAVSARNSLPTLRLFAWNPPCLSLGYAQTFSEVDTQRLSERGWEMVRRITGGRAILHTDELTYSIIAPEENSRVAGNVLESYRRLSLALLDALKRLGLPVEALPKSQGATATPQQPDPICFEVPSHYEITIRGKKLVGSAQARKKGVVLQHGSLPLFGDLTRITQVLRFPDEASRLEAGNRLLERATAVDAALGQPVSWDQAASAFTESFTQVLNLDLREESLSPEEAARAEILVKEKYAHSSWIERI